MQQRLTPLYLLITALFITGLLAANVMSVKLLALGAFVVPAGTIIFPATYWLDDVLTEVWGYRQARFAVWLGFLCNALLVIVFALGGRLPGATFVSGQGVVQTAYDVILGFTPRLLVASFCAYLVGQFANDYSLARLKVATNGKWLWTRTIGSTLLGEGLDSLIFITIAFWGILPAQVLLTTIVMQWLLKSAWETVATPITYALVGWCKHHDRVDTFDRQTNFNPFLVGDVT